VRRSNYSTLGISTAVSVDEASIRRRCFAVSMRLKLNPLDVVVFPSHYSLLLWINQWINQHRYTCVG